MNIAKVRNYFMLKLVLFRLSNLAQVSHRDKIVWLTFDGIKLPR